MDDLHSFWSHPLTLSVLSYQVFLRRPLGNWLHRGFLGQGRVAQMRCAVFNGLLKLRLVAPIALPLIAIQKLTEKPLVQGYEVRLWKAEDTDTCLEIYRLNAPGRFPAEVEQEFGETLKRNDDSMLVIEHQGCVVACGGTSLTGTCATLSYGLIHPEFQGRGIGRLLLLSRLARLHGPPMIVLIYAVEASIGYYERYGFARFSLWYSQNGEAHPSAGTSLHPETRQKIADYLVAEGHPLQPALNA